jgi:hypothetical protein
MRRFSFRLAVAAVLGVTTAVVVSSQGSATHAVEPGNMTATNEQHVEFRVGPNQVVGYWGDLYTIGSSTDRRAGYRGTCVWLGTANKMLTTCHVVMDFTNGGTLVLEGLVKKPGATLFATDQTELPRLAITGGADDYVGERGELVQEGQTLDIRFH